MLILVYRGSAFCICNAKRAQRCNFQFLIQPIKFHCDWRINLVYDSINPFLPLPLSPSKDFDPHPNPMMRRLMKTHPGSYLSRELLAIIRASNPRYAANRPNYRCNSRDAAASNLNRRIKEIYLPRVYRWARIHHGRF